MAWTAEQQRAYNAAYYAKNKARLLARQAQYYIENRARYRLTQAQYYVAHADQLKAYQESYRAEHKDKIGARDAKYRVEHPEWKTASQRKRRAAKRGASICDLTRVQWDGIKALYNHRCIYCGTASRSLTQDHITPLSKGGNHTVTNVVPACRSCNASKSVNHPPKPVQPVLLV